MLPNKQPCVQAWLRIEGHWVQVIASRNAHLHEHSGSGLPISQGRGPQRPRALPDRSTARCVGYLRMRVETSYGRME